MFDNKIKTGIPGLDRLLFGGLQLPPMPKKGESMSYRPLTVVISGESGTYRTLFGMQLLHGLSMELQNEFPRDVEENKFKDSEQGKPEMQPDQKSLQYTLVAPCVISFKKQEQNLSDILLDMVIAKCVRRIIKHNLNKENCQIIRHKFSSSIFDFDGCTSICQFDIDEMDRYIGEEVVIYNNRTNALHFTTPYEPYMENSANADINDLIARRKYNSMNEYIKPDIQQMLPKDLSCEFFNVNIYGQIEAPNLCVKDKTKNGEKIYSPLGIANTEFIPCVVIDNYDQYMKLYSKAPQSLIVIYLENSKNKIKDINPDVWFDLRVAENPEIDYWINQLTIRKAILQNSALGWHQYKNRDYGIEVYPSSNVLLQRRRHMLKAIARANVDILSDTFQQYIDNYRYVNQDNNADDKCLQSYICKRYEEFKKDQARNSKDRLHKIYDSLRKDLRTSSVLSEILVDKAIDGTSTAIIGSANSYKRFLSLAKTFSASFVGNHTLYILLDQDAEKLRKSMVCPTWEYRNAKSGTNIKQFGKYKEHDSVSDNESGNLDCSDCYAGIHFWDVRMGNITSDEFFYYLTQQFESQPKIKQIIIDNIPRINYSFPLLKRDHLFLTTLVSICKEYKKDLVILCDRTSNYVDELRMLADNVICTERVEKETHIYVEQYNGYNAPSHIYACKVKKMEELFYCETHKEFHQYCLNENRVDNYDIRSLDKYWEPSQPNVLARIFNKNKGYETSK
ncbi:hypothetical protein [Paludibacter sp.]|uniref:hypothetical protein n=1 Tax=Paludibacter sp. TaxID=1898105 RepID=UPI001354855D|nr:hypothetical protein [Paludibacter sp.]MTK52943.1 hypothetical protein [Paludibacter sp.]